MMEQDDVVKMLEKLSDISERLAKVEVMLSERSRAEADERPQQERAGGHPEGRPRCRRQDQRAAA